MQPQIAEYFYCELLDLNKEDLLKTIFETNTNLHFFDRHGFFQGALFGIT